MVKPKLIKGYGNNTLRKVETDKADTRKIARYGLDSWAELRQHTPIDTAVSYTHLTLPTIYSV